MKLKNALVCFLVCLSFLVPPALVVVAEILGGNSYEDISKYPFPRNDGPLRFHVIGNLGGINQKNIGNNTQPVNEIAKMMQTQAKTKPISFIISTGNNVYPTMTNNFDPILYNLMYEVFDIEELKGKPWYLSLGTDDCQNISSYEIDAHKLYPMWNMPNNYYNLTFDIGQGKGVALTFLDSCILEQDTHEKFLEQENWLITVLKDQQEDSNIIWKIVVVNIPIWSAGMMQGDNESLKKKLYPLLYEYKVDAVFVGKGKLMQHFVSRYENGKAQEYEVLQEGDYECNNDIFDLYGQESDWIQGQGLHEILQGAGGRDLDLTCWNKTTSMADLVFSWNKYGFSEVYIDTEKFQVNYFVIGQTQPIYSVRVFNKYY